MSKRIEFGPELLLALVMLHYRDEAGDVPTGLFDLLDRQTDAEADYFCRCDDELVWIESEHYHAQFGITMSLITDPLGGGFGQGGTFTRSTASY